MNTHKEFNDVRIIVMVSGVFTEGGTVGFDPPPRLEIKIYFSSMPFRS